MVTLDDAWNAQDLDTNLRESRQENGGAMGTEEDNMELDPCLR